MILGFVTIILAIVSYSLYITDVLRHKTRPHGITWLIWSVLNIFIWYEQYTGGAGPGAWVTALTAGANFFIFLLSLRYGNNRITLLNIACLIGAAIALGIWLSGGSSVLSVCVASITFVIGFIPTIAKSVRYAHEETIMTFALNSLKFLLALFALETVTLVTSLYPFVLFIMNGLFVLFLLFARRKRK